MNKFPIVPFIIILLSLSFLLFYSIVSFGSPHHYLFPITLKPGENIIKIEVTDKAGNVATKNLTIYYEPKRGKK